MAARNLIKREKIGDGYRKVPKKVKQERARKFPHIGNFLKTAQSPPIDRINFLSGPVREAPPGGFGELPLVHQPEQNSF
jgi:hypothetical protein